MKALFLALYDLFSKPSVIGVMSALDAGSHIAGVVKVFKSKLGDDSIDTRIINALDEALNRTCNELGWEYDNMVVNEFKNEVYIANQNEVDLATLLRKYVGPELTTNAINIWVEKFDQVVATDQILTNYFNTKLLRSLSKDANNYEIAKDNISEEDVERFKKVMMFYPSNELVFEILREAISKTKSIIPFVGAGISAFAYGTWNSLLLRYSNSLSDEIRVIVNQRIANNDYLDAAELICDSMGETAFFTALRHFYAEDRIDDNELIENAAYYIPRICNGNCITTNYDRVLEHSSMLNSVVYDIAGINDTLKLTTYYRGQSQRGLIFKLHGDILSNSENILLTRHSYEKHYGKGCKLRKQLEMWIAGRTFLFLGTSLFNDEPIQVLTNTIEEGMINYAVYPCSGNETDTIAKRFDGMNILPIFYDKNDHSCLTTLLKYLTAKEK